MDIVSFETAKRLKEAGFPQPEFAAGQFWYNYDGELFVFTHGIFEDEKYQPGFVKINGLREVWTVQREYKTDNGFFAPTATDIMREIEAVTLYFDVRLSKFRCSGGDTLNGIGWVDFVHENPAEAAALAWLEIMKNANLRQKFRQT